MFRPSQRLTTQSVVRCCEYTWTHRNIRLSMDMWGTAGCPIQTDTYRFAFVTRGEGLGRGRTILKRPRFSWLPWYIHQDTNDWFIGGFCLIFMIFRPTWNHWMDDLNSQVFGVEASQRGLSWKTYFSQGSCGDLQQIQVVRFNRAAVKTKHWTHWRLNLQQNRQRGLNAWKSNHPKKTKRRKLESLAYRVLYVNYNMSFRVLDIHFANLT